MGFVNQPKSIMTLSSPSIEGEITVTKITMEDPYTEEAGDGYKKLVLAAILAYDETGTVGRVENEIYVLSEILERRHREYGWDDFVSRIATVDPQDPENSFKEFFESLDRETDADDRIILILAGHGGIEDGKYFFSIKTYYILYPIVTNDVALDSDSLFYTISILGPAVDFIWFISCKSYEFFNDISKDRLQSVFDSLIGWAYTGKVHVLDTEIDLNATADAYREGNPPLETIYEDIKSCPNSAAGVELVQRDYYLGDLCLLSLHSTSTGGGGGGGARPEIY